MQLYQAGTPLVAMSAPPLMHGTGCWLGMMTPHLFGGTAVLLRERSLDPVEVWDAVEGEGVQHLVIVGDAFAKPLLRALNDAPDRWDLSSLRLVVSTGAMFSSEVKHGLIEHIPGLTIADLLGSTEGGMGSSVTTKDTLGNETAKFTLLRDHEGVHRRRSRGAGQARVRSAPWPTAGWCRWATTRIRRSRRGRSAR